MKNSYDFDWGNRETLGKGNFSTVFGITDRKTGIKYAVHTPIIKPNNDIEEWIKLQRNAQLVSNKIKSRINYPKIQIPKIYEVKEKTGTPLCIMEFIPNLEVGSPRLISNDNISSIVEFFNDLHQLPTKPFEKLFQHYKYRMIFKESSLMNSCGLTHLQDDILKPSVEKSICHGDTSPTNIGISNNKYVAILDWDLAQKNSFLSDIHHFTTDLSTSNSDLDKLIVLYNKLPKPNNNRLKIHPAYRVFSLMSVVERTMDRMEHYHKNDKHYDLNDALSYLAKDLYNAQQAMGHYDVGKEPKKRMTRTVLKFAEKHGEFKAFQPGG